MPCLGASLCMAKCCKIELRTMRVESERTLKPNLYETPNPKNLCWTVEDIQLCLYIHSINTTVHSLLVPSCFYWVFKIESNLLHTRQPETGTAKNEQGWIDIGTSRIFLLLMSDVTLLHGNNSHPIGTKHAFTYPSLHLLSTELHSSKSQRNMSKKIIFSNPWKQNTAIWIPR